VRDATLLLWRARLRHSKLRVLAVVVLFALSGGITLAVAAGARRTAAAYEEVVDIVNGAELGSSYVPLDPDESRALIDALPAVDGFTQLVGFQTFLPDNPVPGLNSYAIYDDVVTVDRPLVIDGRLPRTPDETLLNEAAAAATGLHVGDRVEIVVANAEFTDLVPATMTVVGVGISDVYPDATAAFPQMVYGKSFVDARRDSIIWGGVGITLADGVSREEAATQFLDRGLVIDNDRADDRSKAGAAVRPLTVTLWVLAVLAGVATIVVVGQAVHRLVKRSRADARSLAGAGCSRAMLLAADVGVVLTVGVLGAALAIVVAVLASPLFPQGRARRVDALRGFDLDLATLGLGATALLVALVLSVGVTVWRSDRREEPRPGSAPGVLGRDPAVGTGVRFATGQRGTIATVAGVAVGFIAVVAAVVFTGSMGRLVSRPDLAGFSWDLVGRDGYFPVDNDAVDAVVGDDPNVERITGLSFSDVVVDGVSSPATVWTAIKGSPWPPLVDGRVPDERNEILVGQATLDGVGAEIGDTLTVVFGEDTSETRRSQEMTVVGTAVSPVIGLGGTDTPRLDTGVLVRADDLPVLPPSLARPDGFAFGGIVLFDLVDGADPELVRAQFPDGLPDGIDAATEWFESAEPAEVTETDDAIDVLVLTITALLIGVMATVAHNLLGFVRERRSSFAVLRALGFTPRQLRSTVLWQCGVVVGAAIIVSVPLGIAAGRWLYRTFADDIGVIVEPVVPVLPLALAVLAAITLVQGVALVPAQRARRATAAELRAE